jgi:hypothetical protein
LTRQVILQKNPVFPAYKIIKKLTPAYTVANYFSLAMLSSPALQGRKGDNKQKQPQVVDE